MAETSIALESQQTTSETMRRFMAAMAGGSRGVVNGYEQALEVVESSPQAASVVVQTGAAMVGLDKEFGFYANSTDNTLTIASNSSGNSRIDTVVVELDLSQPAGSDTLVAKIVQGTPAASPVAPTLTQSASVFQYPLADVTVVDSFTVITNANITDRRAFAAIVTPSSVDVQTFTASGTWTKPTNGSIVMVEAVGAGGGGGSGSADIAASTKSGGGGGGSGEYIREFFVIDDLGATETVTIGTGGTGGASQTGQSSGFAGGQGGDTTFGSLLRAFGGGGGSGGSQVGIAEGARPHNSSYRHRDNHDPLSSLMNSPATSMNGGGQSNVSSTADGGFNNVRTPGGGGGGGGMDGSNTEFAGGDGGLGNHGNAPRSSQQNAGGGPAGGAAGGAAGTSASAGSFSGGGGGGANHTGTGGVGGNGDQGGGGGGGGCSTVTNDSGSGGAGGDGWMRVTTW